MIPLPQYIRDGINQLERLMPALEPANVPLDDQNISDLLGYTYRLAEHVRFHNLQSVGSNDWQPFFDHFLIDAGTGTMKPANEIEQALNAKTDFEPHLALFLCFLKLFALVQQDINTITGRHLDFYFEEVLRINRKAAVQDQVHVLFELAKNVKEQRILEHTLLKSGTRDGKGQPIQYRLDRELVVNKAKVTSLKSVFVERLAQGGTVYAAPVSNSADGLGTPFDTEDIKWSAFGESQQDKPSEQATMVEADIGFAVASPQFLLREGLRQITLILRFEADPDYTPFRGLSNAFRVQLSGEEEWIIPETVYAQMVEEPLNPGQYYLQIDTTLGKSQPSVVPYNDELLLAGFETSQPVMQVLLNQGTQVYTTLRPLNLASVEISTQVEGLKQVLLSNDQAVINPGGPFLPFGARPSIGSSLHIGSDEVFAKRLDSLSVRINWHNLPQLPINSFNRYYAAYYPSTNSINNLSFRVNGYLTYKGNSDAQVLVAASIFRTNPNDAQTITVTQADISNGIGAVDYVRRPDLGPLPAQAGLATDGYLRLTLSEPDFTYFRAFGHHAYPNLLTERAINQATGTGEQELPNPPYTPEIKTLELDYTSAHQASLQELGDYEKVFQIAPFGWKEITVEDERPSLLPQLVTDADYDLDELSYKGLFYLGLEDFDPPRSISLLMQVAEGTALDASDLEASELSWSYLSGDRWKRIETEDILTENTRSFRQSGLVQFNIPGDAGSQHHLMPGGMHWIRAEIANGAAVVNQLVDVISQAALVKLDIPDTADPDQFDEHLSKPLSAGQIQALSRRNAAVKKINQPFVSFGGQPYEQGSVYYTRVSERLRHKKRAASAWDYERLVLEKFPSVFKVRCLNHLQDLEYLAPGAVTLIVVSNLRDKNDVNPLEPKTNETQLTDIRDYLLDFALSPFVELNVENPIYERILVDFQVEFFPTYDPGYYTSVLNEEIVRFLSPWAFEEGKDIQFGGRIYKSDIQGFVESRKYVDHITDFKLFQIRPPGLPPMDTGTTGQATSSFEIGVGEMVIGDDFIIGHELEYASAGSPKSILVSSARHRIKEFDDNVCEGFSGLGIGLMTIGVDFEVDISSVF